jgi:hypothetical protein
MPMKRRINSAALLLICINFRAIFTFVTRQVLVNGHKRNCGIKR